MGRLVEAGLVDKQDHIHILLQPPGLREGPRGSGADPAVLCGVPRLVELGEAEDDEVQVLRELLERLAVVGDLLLLQAGARPGNQIQPVDQAAPADPRGDDLDQVVSQVLAMSPCSCG
jgi:hypothetical protein